MDYLSTNYIIIQARNEALKSKRKQRHVNFLFNDPIIDGTACNVVGGEKKNCQKLNCKASLTICYENSMHQ